ncbi:ABC transporter substrate-binding protein [Azospirillum sp. ST 5-10]|uniref:ABC transporter substrate-binding protein n=1 Tax=unclassified Azospirillum TaxID=2630922 RepID=UPI003F4A4032
MSTSLIGGLRALAAAAVLAAGIGGAPAGAAAETVTYLLPAPLSLPAFAPWVLAKHLGYYKDAGYDVEFQVARGGVDVAKQVGAGNAMIGGAIGDTPIIVRANGIPVKAVGVLGGGSMTTVVARADRGVKTLADLKGKTVTALSYQDTTYYALLGSLAAVGLTKNDVNAQAVGPAGVPKLVIAGEADACACTPDWEINVKDGLPGATVSMPTMEYFPSMAQAILASDEAIEKRPELVKAIVRATLKGMTYIMEDPARAAKTYAQAEPSMAGKEELLTRIFANYTERTYKGQDVVGAMDAGRLAKLQDFYLDQGIVQKATPVEELYTNAFVQ